MVDPGHRLIADVFKLNSLVPGVVFRSTTSVLPGERKVKMKARRRLAFFAVGAVAIALGVAGCGNSPGGDGGGNSGNASNGGAPAGEAPSSGGGYGY
jgi:hypothetical protein